MDTAPGGLQIRWGIGATQTPYMDAVHAANSAWGALGTVLIIEDNIWSYEDLTYLHADDCTLKWHGRWDPSPGADELWLNHCQLKLVDANRQKKAVAHELGHALGLDENNTTIPDQLMKQGDITYGVIAPMNDDQYHYYEQWGYPRDPCWNGDPDPPDEEPEPGFVDSELC